MLTFTLLAFCWNLFAAQSGQVSDARPAEYMIYQYPFVSLVIKVDAAETGFDSEIYGPEKALLKSSEVPSSRIGPLYQFVDSVEKPRQLMIKITPERPVDRSQISMELIQLPDRDWKSASFGRAYNFLSSGTEKVHGNDSTTWSMKIYTLRNAASAFEQLGWEEMRLWSDFYAAHLVLHKLNDVLMAMDLSRSVRESASRAGFEEIELAALVLESEALQVAGENATGQQAFRRYEQLHGVLDQVVILADQLNLPSEKARALFNDGLAFEQQDRADEAVRRFQAALDVALTTNNTELTNEIRGTAAVAYEEQGSTTGAIALLEDIGSDLENEAGQEFTNNLFEKGRILNSTYRYQEAAGELDQALSIQRADASTGSWGATGLALAWSYFSMGEMEKAQQLILESIPRTELAANRPALIRSYDVLATIHRHRRQFDQAARYRQQQEQLVDSDSARSDLLFESAVDELKKQGTRSSRALNLMAQSSRLAASAGHVLTGHRAALHECWLRLESGGRGACTATSIRRHFDALSRAGIPWMALEASLVKARILYREGKRGEALSGLENLVDDLLFFHQDLPGVLGAWYWLNRKEVFQQYLEVAAAGSNGEQTLIALDRVRLVDNPASGGRKADELRALLGRRESAADGASADLANQANSQWRNRRNGFSPGTRPIDRSALNRLLGGLSNEEAILSYYFSDSDVFALLGTRDGVAMKRLASSSRLSGQVDRLRQSIDAGSGDFLPYLDALGKSLVQPLSGLLKPDIYLLPAGPLNGFPFDALRLDGKFLAERFTVVNLLSLAGTSVSGSTLSQDFTDSVFLAGNPQTGQDLFSYDVRVSAEVNAVRDAFVGPGLNIVQGVALQKDEFQDPRFAGAGLIHLAIPGTLNLAAPDESELLMSRTSEESVTDNLIPQDIRGQDFTASLVVLSRTGVASSSQSGFDSRLGFVSDFLLNGARNVVVSLRSRDDPATASFMADFYNELGSAGNVGQALSRSKNRLMKSTEPGNFMSWAGFQLYIR